MALSVSKESQLALFKSLFTEFHPVYAAAASLIDNGGKIEVSLYVVKIMYKGEVHSQALTVGTSALMKGNAAEVQVNQNKFILKTFLEKVMGVGLGDAGNNAPASWVKHPQQQPHPEAVQVKDLPENVVNEAIKTPPSPTNFAGSKHSPMQTAKTAKTMALKDATDLGQPVKGTSLGSIYRVVALNDRVKVAAQIKGSDMSLRVEVKSPTEQELTAIKVMFDWKGSYGSKHLALGAVPPSRALGALLFSLEGIVFDKMVHGKKEAEVAYG